MCKVDSEKRNTCFVHYSEYVFLCFHGFTCMYSMVAFAIMV